MKTASGQNRIPDLAQALDALLVPSQAQVTKAASLSVGFRVASTPDATSKSIIVEATIGSNPIARLHDLASLIRLRSRLASNGFRQWRLHMLLVAGGDVYEAVPIAGQAPLSRVARYWLVLLLRGGRVVLSAWNEGIPLADSLVAEASGEWDPPAGATIYLGSGGVFRLSTRSKMLRIPCGRQAESRLERGFHALEHAATLRLKIDVPRALDRIECHGWRVFLESRVPHPGFDYLNMTRGERDAVRAQAVIAIANLHDGSRRVKCCDKEDFEILFEQPIGRLMASGLLAGVRALLVDFLQAARKCFIGSDFALVLSHGDCKIANFLHDGEFKVTGLVDWDRATTDGLPGIDLVHYLAFEDMLDDKGSISETLATRAQAMELDPAFAEYLKRYLLGGRRWRIVGAMALLTHVAEQLEAGNTLARQQMNRNPAIIKGTLEWALDTSAPTD